MDIEDSIETFRQGSFEVDCPTMELKQRKDNGEAYQGSGYIKQDADGFYPVFTDSWVKAKNF